MDIKTGTVHTWKDVTATVEIEEPSDSEIVNVKLSEELAGFYKISGHVWSPRPDLPPPNTAAAALLGRICEVATSCDSAEVGVALVGNLTAECLDYLVELGHLEMIEGS